MKRIIALLAFGCMLFASAAFAADKPLVVAHDTNFKPLEFRDQTGKYVGFDIDLWDAIAKKMGVAYTFQPMNFNGVVPGLQTGQLDVGIAGMSITPERMKVIDVSYPYYNSGLQILVRADDASITKLEDLAGKVISTKLGTSSENFAKSFGKAKEVKLYPNNDSMFMELVTGGADAVIFDLPIVQDFANTVGKGKVKPVGPVYEGQPYGIGFPKGSPLVEKVNAALKALKDDGTYETLYVKWFGAMPEK